MGTSVLDICLWECEKLLKIDGNSRENAFREIVVPTNFTLSPEERPDCWVASDEVPIHFLRFIPILGTSVHISRMFNVQNP